MYSPSVMSSQRPHCHDAESFLTLKDDRRKRRRGHAPVARPATTHAIELP